MLRILPVKEFASRKRVLVAQSDLDRQMLLSQAAEAEQAVAHFKKRFAIFGLTAGAVGAGASVAKLFFGKNGTEEKSSGGLISKILASVSLFRELKSLLSGMMAGRQAHHKTGDEWRKG